MDIYEKACKKTDEVEIELRKLGWWSNEPLPKESLACKEAFCADSMHFGAWIQFILIPKVRKIVSEKGDFPKQSQVSTYAIREFDGQHEVSDLIHLLCVFDGIIEGRE